MSAGPNSTHDDESGGGVTVWGTQPWPRNASVTPDGVTGAPPRHAQDENR